MFMLLVEQLLVEMYQTIVLLQEILQKLLEKELSLVMEVKYWKKANEFRQL
jgi:hypothetical protein